MSAPITCLACNEALEIAPGTYVGEIVQCPACGQEHEILDTTGGFKIGFAPEVEEDWGE